MTESTIRRPGAASGGEMTLEGATLVEALRSVAETAPYVGVTFPDHAERVTNSELVTLGEACAHALIEQGLRPGEVVGLLAPTGPDLLAGLFGIMMAGGAVAVLPVPPGFRDADRHLRRLGRIIAAASMRHIVVDEGSVDHAKILLQDHPELRVVQATGAHARRGRLPAVGPDELAVVQFTSGTTTQPRGVMLSHATVLHALRSILITAEFDRRDVLVQWVPHHHDMGLFGHLSQILNGAESHVFEPLTFLRRPLNLLRYTAAHRATVLTGADFGYELLIESSPPELISDLDLSSWRLAFNGAEPVAAATVRRFATTFEPAGVAPTVMYPVYGMAEATLPITFPKPDTAPRLITVDRDELGTTGRVRRVAEDDSRAKTFVSVGAPVAGAQVRLVDESGRVLGAETLGEVQVSGGMVTSGYLGDPQATAAAFDGRWLRTGDLAFRVGADYFVAGRRKEMVVVRGQNFFPEDAEAAARAVPGIYRQHVVAAAQIDSAGEEYIMVIAETEVGDAQESLRHEIRAQVVAELGMPYVRVYLVDPRWLTRTTSGKWQRLLAASKLREEGRA